MLTVSHVATKAISGCTAAEVAARGSAESGFGFTVLYFVRADLCKQCTYFSDVDEAAHQVLVAESRDSILSLFSSSVLHNSKNISLGQRYTGEELTRIPT